MNKKIRMFQDFLYITAIPILWIKFFNSEDLLLKTIYSLLAGFAAYYLVNK